MRAREFSSSNSQKWNHLFCRLVSRLYGICIFPRLKFNSEHSQHVCCAQLLCRLVSRLCDICIFTLLKLDSEHSQHVSCAHVLTHVWSLLVRLFCFGIFCIFVCAPAYFLSLLFRHFFFRGFVFSRTFNRHLLQMRGPVPLIDRCSASRIAVLDCKRGRSSIVNTVAVGTLRIRCNACLFGRY